MRRAPLVWLGLAMLLAAALGYGVFAPPSGSRSIRVFDPGRMADLELRMWQAYYAKERLQLFALLVLTLREQYHYSWAVAAHEGFHLARAAARFADLRSDYDSVLPDIEAAYVTAKEWSHADFDPDLVAQSELAWWVARRVPGQDSPEHVGELIAAEYALLYDAPEDEMLAAGQARAEAAALRDERAGSPDWTTIERLLRQSYIELRRALSTERA